MLHRWYLILILILIGPAPSFAQADTLWLAAAPLRLGMSKSDAMQSLNKLEAFINSQNETTYYSLLKVLFLRAARPSEWPVPWYLRMANSLP